MSEKKSVQHEKAEMKPYMAWILRHELLSSCGLTLVTGLTIGGIAAFLDRLLV